ncbi:hypothetical protein M430DRAFT_39447 [Amorphotheca resinae ATCC 22711]|uniref:Phytocyanin domain-containing protein n=1 Tax=Amorphotheca resinae ATCC 22711 TaxID=857342 RepID=A0A2T3BAJ5_AMORE|nr:hypothetical protein M430DRAFT_39447 [Amorphotheca resinae ATCC 22711]PSS25345.1 hypothetical protein M430DRAFT_39447 [Amorphotheca resinae ATCC 22711]
MLWTPIVFIVSVLLSSTWAGSTSSKSAASTTASGPAATHTCLVGADGFNFSPNQMYAKVGDIIEYRFYPLNHSVARAGFGNNLACLPYEDSGQGLVGFWSDFQPVAVVLSNPPIFRLLINDTEPVFFYCSAPGACQQGMVGVINPNSSFTYQDQLAYALNTSISFSPLQYFPPEVAITRSTTATGATMTPTPVRTNSPPTAPTSKSSLSTGAIVGIVIAGIIVVLLAAALLYTCGRQKTLGEILRRSHTPAPNTYQPTTPGISEVTYPNIQKQRLASDIMSGQAGTRNVAYAQGTEVDSYRSGNPLGNERIMTHNVMNQGGFMNGHSTPNSPDQAAPSPLYTPPQQEMVHGGGLRPYNPYPLAEESGPHELPANSINPRDLRPSIPYSPKPFSFAESESGYRRDEKIDNAF